MLGQVVLNPLIQWHQSSLLDLVFAWHSVRHCFKSNDAQVSNPEELKQATQCWMSTSSWTYKVYMAGTAFLPLFTVTKMVPRQDW